MSFAPFSRLNYRIGRMGHHPTPQGKRSLLMRHRTSDRLKQLALRLQVDSGCPPVQYESEALLQALVDLLLEACGIPGKERESAQGGVNELEDHV
jgi:hypothetical protein